MNRLRFARYALCTMAVALAAGCGGSQQLVGPGPGLPQTVTSRAGNGARAIRHVIVIVQETRSFDNLFAGFPNADAPTTGMESTGKRVPLRRISLTQTQCQSFGARRFRTAYDNGRMDGWNLINPRDPLCPYTRVYRDEVQPYWDLAKRFALADRMFESTYYGTFVNQLYLIAGTTRLAPRTFDVLYPDQEPWSCDAPAGTKTSLLKDGLLEPNEGPFPCFTQFPTMANLLDDHHVSWKSYFGAKDDPLTFDPFDAIKYVVDGPDQTRNLSHPATNVLADLKNGRLPTVSWVFSPPKDSDLPGFAGGPRWVDSIVAATEKSPYWAHSAVIVVWADAADGNFYDNVAPPQISEVGLGFRVPLVVVSPYAKRGYVSHTNYQFGSILKFIEDNWGLGSLGATDKRSHSIADMFAFNQ